MPKNIILIITDTFRYDNLGRKAERPVRTPELDRFAAERATSVENFWAGSFPTIPHRTDLATGVLAWPHFPWQPLDKSSPNHIAAILRHAGYTSQLICDCPHLFNSRFQHGFDAAFQTRGQEGDRHLLHMNDAIECAVPDAKTRVQPQWHGANLANLHRWLNRYFTCEEQTFAARTAGTAIRWLEENYKAGPFFLWVDFFDPHEPWDPPEYMVRRYDPDYQGRPMIHPNYGPTADFSPEEIHNMWAHYAAESELVDRHIGRVLQKIDDLQLWGDAIVVVTSDHGHSIGDHERTGKTNICAHDERCWPLYPEIARVPFLIAGCEVPRGRSLDFIAQPVDILPSLADLAGARVEPPQPFDGRSFAKALRQGGRHRETAVCGSFSRLKDGKRPRGETVPFVTDGRWGYAPVGPDGKTPELFDLSADPYAKSSLAASNPDKVKEMQQRLIDHLKAHRAPAEAVEAWTARP